MKTPWPSVRDDIMHSVFYAFSMEDVAASNDLQSDGFLDSLALVMIIETLADASGRDDLLTVVAPTDFQSLSAIETLYSTL